IFMIINYSTVFIFGMTLALLMYEMKSKWQKPFFTVIYVPYMISGLGIGLIMLLLFAKDTGSINLLLLKMGIIDKAVNIKDPVVSAWMFPLMVGWRYAGFNMAIFLGGLLSIPPETIEASRVDGANYLQRLWHIYFPQMFSSIMIATVICLIGSWGLFDEAVGMGALAANKNVRFLSILIFKIGFAGTGQSGTLSEALTMAMTVNIHLLGIGILLSKLQKKH
ncbi:MAG: sugar ABC transporter permease, partial [Spirochaetaceae bacterium]|nr:sugar ABC transporter permease [Spirochaetaceae bacterium]